MASRAAGAVPRSTEEVVHRGVTWRRSSAGRVLWYNDGLRRWITWSPGSDAPPLPPGWEKAAVHVLADLVQPGAVRRGQRRATAAPGGSGLATGPPAGKAGANAMVARPSMRSPYRLVPVVIFVLIIALAVFQATRTSSASAQQRAQAYALSGRCLERNGGSASAPSYSATPVDCSTRAAAVKVLKVVEPTRSVVRCPQGTDVAQILLAGVNGEPFECLAPLRQGGKPAA